MLCERCHEREAVISVVEMVDGEEKTVRLCKECAAKAAEGHIAIMHMPASSFLGNILSSFLEDLNDSEEDIESVSDDEDIKKTNIACPSCGTTYDEFLKYGKFGCPYCYSSFNFFLDSYMGKMHGGSLHTGRQPLFSGETVEVPDIAGASDDIGILSGTDSDKNNSISIIIDRDSTVQELRSALKRAVSREEYDDAARIRDMIRECTGEDSHV